VSVFDFKAFKAQFPLFNQPENQSLIYLDNAATTQRPEVVIDAVADFYRHSNANTHRSSHRLARTATAMVERTREKAAKFLNAQSAQEIIFCRGATEGLNLLAHSLCKELCHGDEIILSRAEHHANLVPWQMAAERHGLSLVFLPDKNNEPDISQLNQLITDRTKIVAITAGSNALGFTVDIEAIAKQLSAKEIHLVVDAAQLAAHQAIDVEALACDFLVCSAHKFYGPTGIGLFYGRSEKLAQLSPWQGGGEMIRAVALTHSDYADAPHRFETGTSSLASIAGLEACLDFWQQQSRAEMLFYEQELTNYLHQQLAKVETIKQLSKAENNLGIAAFVPDESVTFAAADLAHWLDEHDIAVRVGHHCAMPLIDGLGEGAILRASLAAYNSKADIDSLVDAIHSMPVIDVMDNDAEKTLNEVEGLSLSELKSHQQWQQRYRQLLKWSDVIQAKQELRQADFLVEGCESAVWLDSCEHDGRCYFMIDSDSRVVKGLAALLLVLINGKTKAEINSLDVVAIFSELQMDKHLSPSRSNGFYALLKRALSVV
jgi:SufS family cysteine desulfurase